MIEFFKLISLYSYLLLCAVQRQEAESKPAVCRPAAAAAAHCASSRRRREAASARCPHPRASRPPLRASAQALSTSNCKNSLCLQLSPSAAYPEKSGAIKYWQRFKHGARLCAHCVQLLASARAYSTPTFATLSLSSTSLPHPLHVLLTQVLILSALHIFTSAWCLGPHALRSQLSVSVQSLPEGCYKVVHAALFLVTNTSQRC